MDARNYLLEREFYNDYYADVTIRGPLYTPWEDNAHRMSRASAIDLRRQLAKNTGLHITCWNLRRIAGAQVAS